MAFSGGLVASYIFSLIYELWSVSFDWGFFSDLVSLIELWTEERNIVHGKISSKVSPVSSGLIANPSYRWLVRRFWKFHKYQSIDNISWKLVIFIYLDPRILLGQQDFCRVKLFIKILELYFSLNSIIFKNILNISIKKKTLLLNTNNSDDTFPFHMLFYVIDRIQETCIQCKK